MHLPNIRRKSENNASFPKNLKIKKENNKIFCMFSKMTYRYVYCYFLFAIVECRINKLVHFNICV